MSKLLDMFTQARRALGGSGMGFLGKNRQEMKPRAAALVIELNSADAANAEAALKAGADGLLFTWDGKDTSWLETLKSVTEAAQASNEKAVCGLRITGGWHALGRESLEQLKDQGIAFIVLPLEAPASLLALHTKDLDLVVTVPMRDGELYPIFIRNLTAFDNITAVQLDFSLSKDIGKLSIEDILQYRAVREAVRFPALLNINSDLTESDAYTLIALGVQALVLTANEIDNKTKQRIKNVRELLEKVHQEDKDSHPTTIK
ncbi:MAG TPA: hypothetical protein DDW33_09385 [Ktedonobacter sp.]|jgi:2-methylisocitrate lyase-like PEP mutase family enzyme|nr:hypothetical protein [Ktedonobacter sp.]HAG99619.1 hypothetical protein [Ktedonobacter sp.]HAT46100.1 hypothetical protein [Ktedonobacter sp.]HBE25884.1 hypothetical protein [Ktedonobacter sp.]HBE28222.1 hypothetical protein [Ktedonobacter sp.]